MFRSWPTLAVRPDARRAGGCRGTSRPDPSQLWQHRPKHGAPAVREREPAGGVSLKQPLQQQGGRGLRRDPGEQPIGGAGDAEQ